MATTFIDLTRDALKTIVAGTAPALSTYFAPDASFLMPQGPYRIEGLSMYVDITKRFVTMSETLDYLHLRQPVELLLSAGSALVTFHFASRVTTDGIPVAFTGYGSALFVGNLIKHLHLTRNPSLGSSITATGGTVSPGTVTSLSQMMWSDSPGE